MSVIFQATVRDKTITISRRYGSIVKHNDDYQIKFDLDWAWKQVPDVVARLVHGLAFYDIPISANPDGEYILTIPRLTGKDPVLKVGVYSPSVRAMKTTNAACVEVSPSILDERVSTPGGTGGSSVALTSRQITAMEELFRRAAYTTDATDAYYEFLYAFGLAVFSLDATTLVLQEGVSRTLVASFYPDPDVEKEITWTSSDPEVATVQAGVVTAIATGNCTITATCGGYVQRCSVEVAASEEVDPPEVTPTYELVAELTADDLEIGGLASTYEGTAYAATGIPYMSTKTNRLSYVRFDIPAEPGYSYKFEHETNSDDTITLGVEFFNTNALAAVAKSEDFFDANREDAGWIGNGTVLTPKNPYNSYPPAAIRICFKKSGTTTIFDGTEVTKVRIYKIATEDLA